MRLLGVNHGPDFLHIKLSEVDLSDRARATLRKSGCSTIHDIITKWDEIRSLPEIKRSTLNEIWQDLIRAAPPGYRFARLPTSPKVRNLAAAISVTYSTDMDEFLRNAQDAWNKRQVTIDILSQRPAITSVQSEQRKSLRIHQATQIIRGRIARKNMAAIASELRITKSSAASILEDSKKAWNNPRSSLNFQSLPKDAQKYIEGVMMRSVTKRGRI